MEKLDRFKFLADTVLECSLLINQFQTKPFY